MDDSSTRKGRPAGKSAGHKSSPWREGPVKRAQAAHAMPTRKTPKDSFRIRTKTDTGGRVERYQGAREKPR